MAMFGVFLLVGAGMFGFFFLNLYLIKRRLLGGIILVPTHIIHQLREAYEQNAFGFSLDW
jgi:type IV secretory pathway VirB3-like protein